MAYEQRRWIRVVVLAGARRRVWVWHRLGIFCAGRQDHAYDVLVELESRWLG
jgi:hypothetical protein